MLDGALPQRRGDEVAFSLLRVLTIGYCLWGSECDVSVSGLLPTLRASRADVARAIVFLGDLNLVSLDPRRHTIRLSPVAVQQLVSTGQVLS